MPAITKTQYDAIEKAVRLARNGETLEICFQDLQEFWSKPQRMEPFRSLISNEMMDLIDSPRIFDPRPTLDEKTYSEMFERFKNPSFQFRHVHA